jgi:hypothetical protein
MPFIRRTQENAHFGPIQDQVTLLSSTILIVRKHDEIYTAGMLWDRLVLDAVPFLCAPHRITMAVNKEQRQFAMFETQYRGQTQCQFALTWRLLI